MCYRRCEQFNRRFENNFCTSGSDGYKRSSRCSLFGAVLLATIFSFTAVAEPTPRKPGETIAVDVSTEVRLCTVNCFETAKAPPARPTPYSALRWMKTMYESTLAAWKNLLVS